MKQIAGIDEVVNQIAEIRNLRKGFTTNFFMDKEKHSLWIQKGVLYSEMVGDSLFLIKKNDGFSNVFYASTTLEELKDSINRLNKDHLESTMMIDLVGRKETCESTSQALADEGFGMYCQLMRMSKPTTVVEYVSSDDVTYATKEEAKDVLALLNQYFDECTEQIPYLEELEKYAEQKHILLNKNGGKISGFVIFEETKVSLYLRYWFVHPNFRERGVGSMLLRRYFYEGRDTRREQLWVICSNENAIKRYRHYGYKDENMFDYVITNKEIQYERENH